MTADRIAAGDQALAALVRGSAGLTLLTGGQTGVDTLAARAALRLRLPVMLIFPRGYRQEDGNLTPSRRRALRGADLHELTGNKHHMEGSSQRPRAASLPG